MIEVRYDGPREEVRTSMGVHRKGEIKTYPDAVGNELIATGVRNRFNPFLVVRDKVKSPEAATTVGSIAPGHEAGDAASEAKGTMPEANSATPEAKGKRKETNR